MPTWSRSRAKPTSAIRSTRRFSGRLLRRTSCPTCRTSTIPISLAAARRHAHGCGCPARPHAGDRLRLSGWQRLRLAAPGRGLQAGVARRRAMLRSPGIRFRPGNRRTCSWSHDRDAASIHAPHREQWLRSTDAPPDANVSIARLSEWRERALAGAATALKERVVSRATSSSGSPRNIRATTAILR